jgi:hypothetical protein
VPLIDPALVAAIARGGNVLATFTLKTSGNTDEIVKKMVKKASDHTKKSAEKLVVFKNLQSFSIDAPADLVEKLASEDDIGTAALG